MTATPKQTRTDAPASAASLALLVLALVVAPGGSHGFPRLPSAEDLAGRVLVDPVATERLAVHYLSTSWQDTEGTWQTLNSLAEIAGQAQVSGPAGDAARLALARLDAALRLAADRDPLRTQVAAERVAAVAPGGVRP